MEHLRKNARWIPFHRKVLVDMIPRGTTINKEPAERDPVKLA